LVIAMMMGESVKPRMLALRMAVDSLVAVVMVGAVNHRSWARLALGW
jgi:hypothetical protein